MKNTLDRKIKAAALREIRSLKRNGLPESEARYMTFIISVDGVLDFMTYDKKEKTWTVEYSVGIGKCHFTLGDTGYYDQTETRTITIQA